jgi:hypothetical protein
MKIRQNLMAIGLIALMAASCGKPDLNARMQAYIDAHNSHNIEKVMELYHDSASFILGGSAVLKGKAKIRDLESWNVATNNRIEVSEIKVKGDTVLLGPITEKNDWLEAAGIDGITHQPGSFVIFKKGRIYEFAPIALEPESNQKLAAFWKSFLPYAKYEHAEDLKKLFSDDEMFIYDPLNAEIWKRMIRDWKILNDTVMDIQFN